MVCISINDIILKLTRKSNRDGIILGIRVCVGNEEDLYVVNRDYVSVEMYFIGWNFLKKKELSRRYKLLFVQILVFIMDTSSEDTLALRDKLWPFILSIYANNSLLIFLGTSELTISTIVQEKDSSFDKIWMLELFVAWFLVLLIETLMYGLFTKIRNIFKDPLFFACFMIFIVATVFFWDRSNCNK